MRTKPLPHTAKDTGEVVGHIFAMFLMLMLSWVWADVVTYSAQDALILVAPSAIIFLFFFYRVFAWAVYKIAKGVVQEKKEVVVEK